MSKLEPFPDLFSEIKRAQTIIGEVAHHTPMEASRTFSQITGGEVYLKLENIQRTGSFKIRGAYYILTRLIRERGIESCIAASAGNHAQGVAYAASKAGITSTVVMPESTPAAKIMATKGYGAKVILHGASYKDAYERALEIHSEKKSAFIHPFDEPEIIAGQGTIGVEMINDMPDLDVVAVPVGGGGLISGVSVAVKNLKPRVKVYGVQSAGAPSMARSLEEGKIVSVPLTATIADGIAVDKPGEHTFKIVRELVDDVVTVGDEAIAHAMFMLLERSKLVVEPAGATGLAALLTGKIDVEGRKVGVVISGGNVDMPILTRVIERSLFEEGRLVKIYGSLPDKPGMLRRVLMTVARARANVVTIEHDRTSTNIKPGWADVTITLEIPAEIYVEELIRRLRKAGHDFHIQPH
ncbi:MAG: threonine ammonia-lyase [Candidatus Geothermarchaeales archaeon]